MDNLILDLMVLVEIILVVIVLVIRVKLLFVRLLVLDLAGTRPLNLQRFGLVHLSVSSLQFGSLRRRHHLLLIGHLLFDRITKIFFVSLIGRGSFEFARSRRLKYTLLLFQNDLRRDTLFRLLKIKNNIGKKWDGK